MKVYVIEATNNDNGFAVSVWSTKAAAEKECNRLNKEEPSGRNTSGGSYGYDVTEFEVEEEKK